MTDRSVHESFTHFRRIRDDIRSADNADRDEVLREGAVLGVGILLGGGFPGAAASVTVLLEGRFPDALWPWDGAPA